MDVTLNYMLHGHYFIEYSIILDFMNAVRALLSCHCSPYISLYCTHDDSLLKTGNDSSVVERIYLHVFANQKIRNTELSLVSIISLPQGAFTRHEHLLSREVAYHDV